MPSHHNVTTEYQAQYRIALRARCTTYLVDLGFLSRVTLVVFSWEVSVSRVTLVVFSWEVSVTKSNSPIVTTADSSLSVIFKETMLLTDSKINSSLVPGFITSPPDSVPTSTSASTPDSAPTSPSASSPDTVPTSSLVSATCSDSASSPALPPATAPASSPDSAPSLPCAAAFWDNSRVLPFLS